MPDLGVSVNAGMWMEDYYERVMSRQSVYFHIGGWGCFVKAIVMVRAAHAHEITASSDSLLQRIFSHLGFLLPDLGAAACALSI